MLSVRRPRTFFRCVFFFFLLAVYLRRGGTTSQRVSILRRINPIARLVRYAFVKSRFRFNFSQNVTEIKRQQPDSVFSPL